MGFSAYLTAIEVFVLHVICLYCVASAALTVLIFALTLLASFLGWQAHRPSSTPDNIHERTAECI